MPLSASSEGPASQATKLPQAFNGNLVTISPFEEKENYDIWLFQLQSALQQYDLEDLIDSTIPRPDANDPEYENWKSLSKFVKGWHAQQLGNEMTRKVLGTTWNLEFADDLMNAIEEHHGVRRTGSSGF